MTDLQHRYRELREANKSHGAAVRALSRELAIDEATVGRTLRRADAASARTTGRRSEPR